MKQVPLAQVDAEDDGEIVHLRLHREEALALAEVLQNADNTGYWKRRGERLRGVAQKIYRVTRPKEVKTRSSSHVRPDRPSNQFPSEFDREHALTGSAPFPILCLRDLVEVYPQLEEKGLSAPEIAERLHVDERTVYRWRKQLPSWMEKFDEQTDPAG